MLSGIVLLVALSAPTVALIINGQTRIVTVVEAERLLKSPDLRKRAAAEIALGTRPDEMTVTDQMFKHDFERERWQRQPLQRPIPDIADQ